MKSITPREQTLLNQIKLLTSEQRNSSSEQLDCLTTREILSVINDQDRQVPDAVAAVLDDLAPLIEQVVAAFNSGGRLIYLGAGTSGRLGILDAVECPPTFSVDAGQVVGLIAGGEKAIHRAVEGAEDSLTLAVEDLQGLNLSAQDVVVGIAASGRTPYVIGGLKFAQSVGCYTGAISCNEKADIFINADSKIAAVVGPEVLTGSTRMKSGTAQKLILNMITTTAMIRVGKVYKNLMIDVKASNEKLFVRAIKIVCEATGAEADEAKTALEQCNYRAKTAILMILSGMSSDDAEVALQSSGGLLREALVNAS